MHHRSRSVAWHGQVFQFTRLEFEASGAAQWAVSRRGEFIGTMACSTEITTRDFDVRCLRWLVELLDGAQMSSRHP
jgi:hypothetical protein